MASLKFIMDFVDDQPGPNQTQKDQDSSVPAIPVKSSTPLLPPGRRLSAIATSSSLEHLNNSNQVFDQSNKPGVAPAARSQRRDPLSLGASSSASSQSARTAPVRGSIARRVSTASNESVDQDHGSAASSSSLVDQRRLSQNLMRPMSGTSAADMSVKLTPITGRISRAKKGKPVHTCNVCKPPKTFTRAEHLRRHQLSHQTPRYVCSVPGCDKAFHRPDLLLRHQQRHEQDDDLTRPSPDSQVDSGRRSPPVRVSDTPGSGPAPADPMAPSLPVTEVSRPPPPPADPPPDYGDIPIDSPLSTSPSDTPSNSDSNVQWPSPSRSGIPVRVPGQSWNPQISYNSPVFTTSFLPPPSYTLAQSPTFGIDYPVPPAQITTDHFHSVVAGSLIETDVIGCLHPPLGYLNGPDVVVRRKPGEDGILGPVIVGDDIPIRALSPGVINSGPLLSPVPLLEHVRAAIPRYLEVYWNRVDPLFPLVHRPSFASAPEILRCAMAAVATQYFDDKEDRVQGTQLYEYAWQEIRYAPRLSTHTMQAVLLCEYFARFRGRKAVTRPSSTFTDLYSRVSAHDRNTTDHGPFGGNRPVTADKQWQAWIDAELHRRILAACFLIDVHTSVYQQQRRAHDYNLSGSQAVPLAVPLTSGSADLWEAASSAEWSALLKATPGAGEPVFLHQVGSFTPQRMEELEIFDRNIILAAESLKLPRLSRIRDSTTIDQMSSLASQTYFDLDVQRDGHMSIDPQLGDFPTMSAEKRISSLFPGSTTANTYLALHHTPLHDLLAVSGDSWVFSQKVLPVNSFLEHKKSLKRWAEQHDMSPPGLRYLASAKHEGPCCMDATKATIYATRAILGFLEGTSSTQRGRGSPERDQDISDYWGLYVCALICWAYVYQQRADEDIENAGHGVNSYMLGNTLRTPVTADEGTYAWLRSTAEMRIDDHAHMPVPKEAIGIVALVRRHLEMDCIGSKSRLFVDAVGVLKKLEEYVNWSWF